MLAKFVDAVIDPVRMDQAVAAVEHELIPEFLEHDGALHGYWSAEMGSGHVLALTVWRDADALLASAAAHGAARATVGERIGLRLCSVTTLPVLATSRVSDRAADRAHPEWIRVTWVDGVTPAMRDGLPQLYRSTVADQSASAGFCGSYWLGDERSPEACAVSLWDGTADLVAGSGASRRRRRRLARALGFGIKSVHEYRTFAVAHAAPERAGVAAEVATV